MNLIFLLSVILKGLGAVLEILLQILITDKLEVSGYGTYSAWINSADLIFWVCFSGLVKCNTFYLSGGRTTIRGFKRNYFLRYTLPVLGAAGLLIVLGGKGMFAVVPLITMLELLVMDRSSTLITRGQSMTALLGEDVLGRLILVAGVLVLGWLDALTHPALLVLYVTQYVLVILFFLLRQGRGKHYTDISGEVSLQKWGAYQRSDLMHAMIEQMPVVMEYFFSGAFEAGVVSVVLLVKKLINFISGPTAKIFLPEFSRLYHAGEHDKIRSVYGSIMRIQMLVVGPLAVVLMGFPRVILGVLAKEELVSYDLLFMGCAVIFLFVATLGPCGGILQMTGNEKTDNRIRFWALVLMGVVMVLTVRDDWFVLYGLCVQVAAEAVAKYVFICRWMKRAPTGLLTYCKWWILPGAAIAAAYLLGVNDSFVMMVLLAGGVFAVSAIQELRNPETALSRMKK